MNSDSRPDYLEQICNMIDLLRPCMNDYLYVYDFIHDFYYISSRATSRFLLPSHSFTNVISNLQKVVYPDDFPVLQEELCSLLSGEQTFHNLEYRWMDLNGSPIWVNCCGQLVQKNGKPIYMVGCLNEIGKQQRADNISGLLSKASFQHYVQAHPAIDCGYVLHLGLDDFKKINQKYGVEYGDMILKKSAECISSCISSTQKLYRIVADEFIIIDLSSSVEEAKALYHQIRLSINRFVEENYFNAVYTISGGILSLANAPDASFSTIMKLSEFALNEAKCQGKNRYYVFAEEDYSRFLRKQDLTFILRQAVYHDFEGFEVYFQPLYHTTTRTIYGAEALMRFHSEKYGMVSPNEFIPILEETKLMIPAGRWIMKEALAACHEIQQKIPNFRININISHIQIMNSDIINEVVATVNEYGISPSDVVLELTESGLLESDARFTRLWSLLKNKGIHLALDDFGTGYSNFHYLNDLRPDIIKIDRSFTAKALENDYEYNLLSLMSGMVHDLNLKICVEGIETAEEQVRISGLYPDFEQGFFFGKPCTYQQFRAKYVDTMTT